MCILGFSTFEPDFCFTKVDLEVKTVHNDLCYAILLNNTFDFLLALFLQTKQ